MCLYRVKAGGNDSSPAEEEHWLGLGKSLTVDRRKRLLAPAVACFLWFQAQGMEADSVSSSRSCFYRLSTSLATRISATTTSSVLTPWVSWGKPSPVVAHEAMRDAFLCNVVGNVYFKKNTRNNCGKLPQSKSKCSCLVVSDSLGPHGP